MAITLTERAAVEVKRIIADQKLGTETVLRVGPALVRWREAGALRERHVNAGQALRFTFPPGIPHAMQNTGDRPLILTSFSTHPHDRDHPDTVRAELIVP